MSNFAFGHNVFKSRLLLLRQNASAGGKGLKQILNGDNALDYDGTVHISSEVHAFIRNSKRFYVK